MTSLKKRISDLLYAFGIVLHNGRFATLQHVFFTTVSSIAGFAFDVYFLAYLLGRLITGCTWHEAISICLFGALLVLIRIGCGEYAKTLEVSFLLKNIEMVEMTLYKKSLDFSLAECVDKNFYDEYSFVLSHGPENVNKSVSIIEQLIVSCIYCVFFITEFFHQDIIVVLTMSALLAVHVVIKRLISKTLVDIRYKNDLALQPFRRKNDYFQRLFYLKTYAYNLKNNRAFDYISDKYEESATQYEQEDVRHEKKTLFLVFLENLHDNSYIKLIVPLLLITLLRYRGVNDVAVYWQLNAMFFKLTSLYLFTMSADVLSLSRYIRKMREFLNKESKSTTGGQKLSSAPSIHVRDLCFSYDDNSAFSLKKLTLDVAAGEKIAIVGPNGSGKTTLLNILLGLYLPNSGQVQIDKKSVSEYCMDENTIGLMLQDFNLYSTTLKNNISMGDDKYTDEAIMQAARLAGCDEFVKDLPMGLDSMLGQDLYKDATELSGGQAQRIALARIFLSHADLLFMDEPTAAIDPLFENSMMKCLMEKTGGKTVVMITHRLDITRYVDHIYVMENGEIIEQGAFHELMEKKTVFRDMYRAQFGEHK